MAPLSADLDRLVPPAFKIPVLILVTSCFVESVPIKDTEEQVTVEFTGCHTWNTAPFLFVTLKLDGHFKLALVDGIPTSACPCTAAKLKPGAKGHPEVPTNAVG